MRFWALIDQSNGHTGTTTAYPVRLVFFLAFRYPACHFYAVFQIRIRIWIHRIYLFLGLPDPDLLFRGILLLSFYHQAKIVKKTLIPTVLWLLLDFLSLKNYVNVPSKSNKLFFKVSFLLASGRSMMWIAGSGSKSGSNNQRHGSADPDPHQNVMDPEHCFYVPSLSCLLISCPSPKYWLWLLIETNFKSRTLSILNRRSFQLFGHLYEVLDSKFLLEDVGSVRPTCQPCNTPCIHIKYLQGLLK